MLERLFRNWVYGGALAGVLILCLSPVILAGWSWPMIAVFLQLPFYMLHQYEEHDDDRFGRFINAELGGGTTVLSPAAIFVVNIFGVWGVNAVSIWLAARYGVGFGLIGIYLTLVNAAVHVAPALRFRRYNPGVATAVIVFGPLGLWALLLVSATPGVTAFHHALGLASAVLIHAAVMAYVFSNRRKAGK